MVPTPKFPAGSDQPPREGERRCMDWCPGGTGNVPVCPMVAAPAAHFGGHHGGHHGGHGDWHGGDGGGDFGDGGDGGGGFGVRRPLRFLAYKLGLDERQVTELARVLNELKLERAQAEVDRRRTVASLADAVAGEAFDDGQGQRGRRPAGQERGAPARRGDQGAAADPRPARPRAAPAAGLPHPHRHPGHLIQHPAGAGPVTFWPGSASKVYIVEIKP